MLKVSFTVFSVKIWSPNHRMLLFLYISIDAYQHCRDKRGPHFVYLHSFVHFFFYNFVRHKQLVFFSFIQTNFFVGVGVNIFRFYKS